MLQNNLLHPEGKTLNERYLSKEEYSFEDELLEQTKDEKDIKRHR